MATGPFVEQYVGGPAIEAAYERRLRGRGLAVRFAAARRLRLHGRQNGDVADSAKVADYARFVRRAEHLGMKSGDERGALAPGRHVTAAEIGDDVDMRHLREQRRIVDLTRVAFFGAVAHRLPVYADCTHDGGRDVRTAQQFVAADGIARRERR